MASTYVNDLRLEEIGTGEQSGTWGDTTNTNLELIAEAFSFGTEAITTNADTHTTTIADGATDPGRSMFLKYTGTLDSACTITIGPNTVSKLWFIENGTSGSQNIIISQGSGANITIPPGDTKAIYSDGAGSGAAMVDAFASLNVIDLKVQDDLSLTSDSAVLNIGADNDLKITHDGTNGDFESAGDLTLDVAGDIILDADGGDIFLADNSVTFGKLKNSSSHFFIQSLVADKDILIIGNDNGSEVTAVEFDMSDAGTAKFNSHIKLSDDKQVFWGDGTVSIQGDAANEELSIGVNNVSALSFSSSAAVFNDGGGDIDFRIEGDTLPSLFHVDAGDDSIGINSQGTGGALVTVQGRAGSSGSEITTKGVHIIEGGFNNGNTFQVSDSSSNARFAVNGYGSSSVGGDTTLAQWFNADGTYGTKFQVQTLGDDTDQNYVTAAFIKSRNDTSPSYVVIGKNRGGAVNSDTTINGSDSIGAISFQGADGTTYLEAARISSQAGAGWGANDGVANIEFYTNSGTTSVSKKMTVESGGDVTIEDGNLVIGTAGHGINFAAYTALSGGTSQILDRYEEGAYDATLTCDSGSITLTNNALSYTIIGRNVYINGRVSVGSVSSPSGNTFISLPYSSTTAIADNGDYNSMMAHSYGVNLPSDTVQTFWEVSPGSSGGLFLAVKDDAVWENINANNIAAGDILYVSGHYVAA